MTPKNSLKNLYTLITLSSVAKINIYYHYNNNNDNNNDSNSIIIAFHMSFVNSFIFIKF